MKPFLLAALCALPLALSCEDATGPSHGETTGAVVIFDSGKLLVRVYFEEGLPDKRVEVLELGLVRKTDGAGYVRFSLPAGDYTIRAYEINRGGPAMLYVDTPVRVRARETSRIEIFDCVPCV
jgi:hypothetical protein